MVRFRSFQILLAVVATLVLLPSLASAQDAPEDTPVRSGFWLNFGTGSGSLGCDACLGREWGSSGGLALGGAVSPRWLLGVGVNGWSKNTLTVVALTTQARFYPSATGGFFLLGGLGYGGITSDLGVYGEYSEAGQRAVLGLGYDIRLNDALSLSLFWNGVATAWRGGDANVSQIGVGLMVN